MQSVSCPFSQTSPSLRTHTTVPRPPTPPSTPASHPTLTSPVGRLLHFGGRRVSTGNRRYVPRRPTPPAPTPKTRRHHTPERVNPTRNKGLRPNHLPETLCKSLPSFVHSGPIFDTPFLPFQDLPKNTKEGPRSTSVWGPPGTPTRIFLSSLSWVSPRGLGVSQSAPSVYGPVHTVVPRCAPARGHTYHPVRVP